MTGSAMNIAAGAGASAAFCMLICVQSVDFSVLATDNMDFLGKIEAKRHKIIKKEVDKR